MIPNISRSTVNVRMFSIHISTSVYTPETFLQHRSSRPSYPHLKLRKSPRETHRVFKT